MCMFSISYQRIIDKLTRESGVISLFNTIKQYSVCSLDKETSLNLLADKIKLYVRVRSFSIAKTKIQLESKRVKGLRKGIKISSDNRDLKFPRTRLKDFRKCNSIK